MAQQERQGCGIYPFHPYPCQAYECGSDTQKIQLLLVDHAEHSGNVSKEVAEWARERIISGEIQAGNNVWDQKGCATGEGSTTCDSCCTVKGVQDTEFGEDGFTKPIMEKCPFALRPQQNNGFVSIDKIK
jgi:hypothetical protein